MIRSASLLALVLAIAAPPPASAAIEVRVGPSAGYRLVEGPAMLVGADARITSDRSPLTLNPTFEHHVDPEKAFRQFGFNALYALPARLGPVAPYVGAGLAVTTFAYAIERPDRDNEGGRIGLNLVGGLSADLPGASPFLQARATLGEIPVLTVSGGCVIRLGGEVSR